MSDDATPAADRGSELSAQLGLAAEAARLVAYLETYPRSDGVDAAVRLIAWQSAEIERLRAKLSEVEDDRKLWIRRADKTWHERFAVENERNRCATLCRAMMPAEGVIRRTLADLERAILEA